MPRSPAVVLWIPVLAGLLVLSPLAEVAWGAEREASGNDRLFSTSSSGRFRIAGPDAVGNMRVSRWAENTADQLERFSGIPFPLRRGWPVEIRLGQGSDMPGLQMLRDGEGYRRVLTLGPESQADSELLEEWLCRALLSGVLEERRRATGHGSTGRLPEWLTMGMAQNLRMEQRVRNRNVVSAWRVQDSLPEIGAMMRWESLPAGWPRQRALCGMLVNWISTHNREGSPFVRILERLAGGEPLTPEWLAVKVAGSESIAAMQAEWVTWMRRQSNLVQSFGEISPALIEQLQAEIPLVIRDSETGGPESAFTPRMAIQARKDAAVLAAALEKSRRLRVLTLGRASELMAAGERYARFYEDLVNGAPSLLLRYRIHQADAELGRLAELTRRRSAYLDTVERESEDRRRGWVDGGIREAPVLEKGLMELYVDGVERTISGKQAEDGK